MFAGATKSFRYSRCREYPVRELNKSVTSAAMDRLQVNRPMSVYCRAVLEL